MHEDNRMRVIGITGGIGTGKSTILKILEKEYGAHIMETDKLAHKLMSPEECVYDKIVSYFGEEILNEDKTIHRGKLGQIVFRNREQLQQLNNIVHPAVKNYILQDIDCKRNEGQISYYVIEAALLIEDGYKAICDELWYIYASQETRVKRLLAGRGGDEAKWLQVITNQSSEEFYKENCDVLIDNSGSVEKTTVQINELL